MPEQSTPAASSPAETEDVFNGETPTLEEFNHYRSSGEIPERFKPAAKPQADSAPADLPKETAKAEGDEPENVPDPAPDDEQEPPQNLGAKARRRFEKLAAEVKELKAQIAAQPKTDAKPESSTAPAPQQAVQPGTRPKPKPDGMNQEGKPYETYEDYVEDLADWKAEQRIAAERQRQVDQQAQAAIRTKMDDARARYEDADETILPTAKTIHEAQIPAVVKQVIEDSEVYVDLCYVAGSDPDELQKFIALAQRDPRAAIGKVFEYERGIKEELAKNGTAAAAPEKKRTQAPAPPTPVGGASSRGFDVNDDSLSADEWFQKRNAQLERRRA